MTFAATTGSRVPGAAGAGASITAGRGAGGGIAAPRHSISTSRNSDLRGVLTARLQRRDSCSSFTRTQEALATHADLASHTSPHPQRGRHVEAALALAQLPNTETVTSELSRLTSNRLVACAVAETSALPLGCKTASASEVTVMNDSSPAGQQKTYAFAPLQYQAAET